MNNKLDLSYIIKGDIKIEDALRQILTQPVILVVIRNVVFVHGLPCQLPGHRPAECFVGVRFRRSKVAKRTAKASPAFANVRRGVASAKSTAQTIAGPIRAMVRRIVAPRGAKDAVIADGLRYSPPIPIQPLRSSTDGRFAELNDVFIVRLIPEQMLSSFGIEKDDPQILDGRSGFHPPVASEEDDVNRIVGFGHSNVRFGRFLDELEVHRTTVHKVQFVGSTFRRIERIQLQKMKSTVKHKLVGYVANIERIELRTGRFNVAGASQNTGTALARAGGGIALSL